MIYALIEQLEPFRNCGRVVMLRALFPLAVAVMATAPLAQ